MKIAAYTPRAARYEIGFVWFSSLNLRKVWEKSAEIHPSTSRNGAPSHAHRAARFARVIGCRAYLR